MPDNYFLECKKLGCKCYNCQFFIKGLNTFFCPFCNHTLIICDKYGFVCPVTHTKILDEHLVRKCQECNQFFTMITPDCEACKRKIRENREKIFGDVIKVKG